MRSALLPPPLMSPPAPVTPLRGCLAVIGCIVIGFCIGALVTASLHATSEALQIAAAADLRPRLAALLGF